MGVAAMQSAEDTFGGLHKLVQAVLDRQKYLSDQYVQMAASRSLGMSLALGTLAACATAFALVFGWVLQRRIVREIQQAVRVSQEVASGNLQYAVTSERSDEIGDLLRSTGHMTSQLRELLRSVRQATDSVCTTSEEIAGGNMDLSRRTEQAAQSLQQTASSMAKLTGTVEQTAASAMAANELAGSASALAERGGNAVQQVISTMREINSSSQRIADIIGTIDGIAFQTNILALNAAVEAARAGEQGRGFAVVAGEVRALAQRSATAAREIKTLIQASLEQVEGGTSQVQTAGDQMAEIVGSVRRVSSIIGEISQSASEQSGGIGQVNGAVSSLDEVTQQNAAMVEQGAASAESLKEQAARLGMLLERFKL